MANAQSAARTNYVRFANLDALRAALAPFSGIEISPDDNDPSKHCLLASNTDDGGWPSGGEDAEFEWRDHVCPHLAEGEVLIVMESGHERLRYVYGYAFAFTRDGFVVDISITDIYELAATKLRVPLNTISAAEY